MLRVSSWIIAIAAAHFIAPGLVPAKQDRPLQAAWRAGSPAVLSLGAQSPVTDTSWRIPLNFRTAGSGIWIASNERYRTADNGEPRAYGQRYWAGLGRTTLHGCLWGEYESQRPVFWHFFTAWDPSNRQYVVHQESGTGIIGLGAESLQTGMAEQTFTRPDGVSYVERHMTERRGADTLVTRSFQREGTEWTARRVYTWVRQPAGVASGC